MLFISAVFFFSSRRRHTRCALVTGVQTCALPILDGFAFLLGGEQRWHVCAGARFDRRERSTAEAHSEVLRGPDLVAVCVVHDVPAQRHAAAGLGARLELGGTRRPLPALTRLADAALRPLRPGPVLAVHPGHPSAPPLAHLAPKTRAQGNA